MALIYLVAGEASGDVLGARLMAALRARRPDSSSPASAAPRMAGAGLREPVPDGAIWRVMGLLEVLPRIRLLSGASAARPPPTSRRGGPT